jgi:hypothetical protein
MEYFYAKLLLKKVIVFRLDDREEINKIGDAVPRRALD